MHAVALLFLRSRRSEAMDALRELKITVKEIEEAGDDS